VIVGQRAVTEYVGSGPMTGWPGKDGKSQQWHVLPITRPGGFGRLPSGKSRWAPTDPEHDTPIPTHLEWDCSCRMHPSALLGRSSWRGLGKPALRVAMPAARRSETVSRQGNVLAGQPFTYPVGFEALWRVLRGGVETLAAVLVDRPGGRLSRRAPCFVVNCGLHLAMVEVRKTAAFAEWYAGLRDVRAQARIDIRIRRLELGLAGDAKPVGAGVSEMRIDYGPGYRVYFVRRGTAVAILLGGDDKSSQAADIKAAKAMAEQL